MKPAATHAATSPLQRDTANSALLSASYRAVRVAGDERTYAEDDVAIEEPLQVRLAGEDVAVLMRTPGHDADLVTGYLFSEGVIRSSADIDEIFHCQTDSRPANTLASGNIVNVLPSDRALLRPSDWGRLSEGYSSCGICGKTSIDQVVSRVPPVRSDLQVGRDLLFSLLAKIKSAQSAFQRTGGLHAAALFNPQGELLVLREDVGRHNAVDKVIGYSLLRDNIPMNSSILAVTSRASFEIVQKAANAGVPLLAVMSAPSSLAVDLARECGLTLVAFLRTGRFNIYSGEERIRQGITEGPHGDT